MRCETGKSAMAADANSCLGIYTCYTMNGSDPFDWNESNEYHVLAHGVEPGEVEEALLDPERMRAEALNEPGERRLAFTGATEEGRILFVVYTKRGEKVRPITARDASEAQKRRYRRRRR